VLACLRFPSTVQSAGPTPHSYYSFRLGFPHCNYTSYRPLTHLSFKLSPVAPFLGLGERRIRAILNNIRALAWRTHTVTTRCAPQNILPPRPFGNGYHVSHRVRKYPRMDGFVPTTRSPAVPFAERVPNGQPCHSETGNCTLLSLLVVLSLSSSSFDPISSNADSSESSFGRAFLIGALYGYSREPQSRRSNWASERTTLPMAWISDGARMFRPGQKRSFQRTLQEGYQRACT